LVVQRVTEVPLSIVHEPDLALGGADLHQAPLVTAVNQLTELRAIVHNIGPASAESALVTFRDVTTGDTLLAIVKAIPARDSAEAKGTWLPSVSGSHTISVSATWLGGSELQLTNNAASLVVAVTGTPSTTDVNASNGPQGHVLLLGHPRPNPSTREFTMEFDLPTQSQVRLDIYDVRGRHVRRLVNRIIEPGHYSERWQGTDDDGANTASGVYFVRLVTSVGSRVQRCVLIR
jgi:hypothetical protein